MAEDKGVSKLGNNPLEGPLDWMNDPLATPDDGGDRKLDTAHATPEQGRGEAEKRIPSIRKEEEDEPVPYRRHTLIMKVDQIDLLDRMMAIEKLKEGSNAKTKTEIVEEIFAFYFESEEGQQRLSVG